MTEERFDQLLEQIRDESPSTEEVSAATARVRERLRGPNVELCSGFRAELADYLANGLSDSSKLLLEDHLARCPDCRAALAREKGGAKVVEAPIRRTGAARWTRWAMAAGVVFALLFAGRQEIDRAFAPSGPRATVVMVSNDAYRLPAEALTPGAELLEDESIRVGAGARAVLALADGSRIEVNERTKLSVRSAWSGQTVVLDYGDVLVEAAPQSRGRLRVVTRDSVAAVKGTVFAVSSATAGSLVSVVEGSVEVSQSGSQKVLQAGEQAASSAALKQVHIGQAIGWSEEAERYLGLLAEFASIERELAALPGPGVRTDARLLRHLPTGAAVYAAVPNLNGTIAQAVALIEQRVASSETLAEWWSSREGEGLREVAAQIQTIGPLLGDEIVFALAPHPGQPGKELPMILAEVQAGKEAELREAIDGLADGENVPIEISDGLMLASENVESLTILSASLGGGSSTEFAAEIEGRYQEGISWLLAVDIAGLGMNNELRRDEMLALGVGSMRYLFLERRPSGVGDGNRATLSFDGPRSGIASWLAAPGPAGSAEYVSRDAVAAFSASARDPREALEELIEMLGAGNDLAAELDEMEAETGVNLLEDVAASLGQDVTVAIEQPTLPTPGWIIAFEAMNPGALDDTARRLVELANQAAQEQGKSGRVSLTEESIDGRAWRSITATEREPDAEGSVAGSNTLHWTYDRGYLIGSSDRAVAMRAIATRESGAQLIYSDKFESSFPSTTSLHHSAFAWIDPSQIGSDLAALVSNPTVANLLEGHEPMLVVIDGEEEQITAASRTRLTSVLLDAMLLSGAAIDSAPEKEEQL